MMMWRILLALCLAVPAAYAGDPPTPVHRADDADTSAAPASDSELRAEVPALSEFHEVVAVLWHDAWPDKDTAMMKELLPQAQAGVAKVRDASLPGILRDKQETWDKGVEALGTALSAYEAAAASGEEQALLDAVEALHARFEDLIWTVRPVMKELGAYHVELYKVYHYYLPGKDLANLRTTVEAMGSRCSELAGAAVPRWFRGDTKALGAGIASLCSSTYELGQVASSEDWKSIEEATERVHSQYRKVESLFE